MFLSVEIPKSPGTFYKEEVTHWGRGLPSTRFEGCLIRSRTKCFRGIWWVHWCICSCLWLVAKWLKISHTKGYDSEHLQDDALWIFFASKKLNLCCAAPDIRSSGLSWIAHDDALRGSDHWNNWIPCGHWRWANLSKQLGHAMGRPHPHEWTYLGSTKLIEVGELDKTNELLLELPVRNFRRIFSGIRIARAWIKPGRIAELR